MIDLMLSAANMAECDECVGKASRFLTSSFIRYIRDRARTGVNLFRRAQHSLFCTKTLLCQSIHSACSLDYSICYSPCRMPRPRSLQAHFSSSCCMKRRLDQPNEDGQESPSNNMLHRQHRLVHGMAWRATDDDALASCRIHSFMMLRRLTPARSVCQV